MAPSPLIIAALSFGAGILLGQAFLYFPLTTIAAALFLAFSACRAMRSADRPLWTSIAYLAPACAGAASLVIAVSWFPQDHYLRSGPFDGSQRTATGRIVSPLDRDPQRTAFQLSIETLDEQVASGKVRATVRNGSIPFGFGDRIEVKGRFFPPRGSRNPGGFDYPAHLARQGIYGSVNIKGLRVIKSGSGPFRTVQDLRERIRQTFLAATTGDGSAVLQAMVLGEEGGLTDDLRDRFMVAGVTHILSISGSHLGLVAILCFWTCRQVLFLLPEKRYHWLTLRADPQKIAAVLTVLPVTFYAFLAGGQVATLRALIMILAGLAALLLDRDGDLLSALALAALITLLPAPRALFDLSFQLSYLSVIAILFVVHVWRQLELDRTAGPRKWLLRGVLLLVISLATALATGPLVAHHFRQISLAGLVANMIVVPFAGAVVVPLGLCSGIASLFLGGLPFAALNQAAADLFVHIVSAFAAIPFAYFSVAAPGPLQITGAAGLLLAGALRVKAWLLARYQPLAFSARSPRSTILLAAGSLVLLVLAAAPGFMQDRKDTITFLDVGQGDCALVQTADEKNILIDGGGTRDNRFDVGGKVVTPYLRDRGIRTIDLAVLSHPHPDHMQGLTNLLERFQVRELWWSGEDGDLEGFATLRETALRRGTEMRAVAVGQQARVGQAVLEVLHPDRSHQPRDRRTYAKENDRSLVMRLRLGDRTVLFPGDVHLSGETGLLRRGTDIRSDMVKVPHHGSRSSSSDAFVRAVRPSLAVISVGAGNLYRHPAQEVVDRYRAVDAEVLRTDRDGAVIVHRSAAALDALRWSELLLQTTDPLRIETWGRTERRNWELLWIRTTEI